MADYATSTTPQGTVGGQTSQPLTAAEIVQILSSGGSIMDLLLGRNSQRFLTGSLNQPLPLNVGRSSTYWQSLRPGESGPPAMTGPEGTTVRSWDKLAPGESGPPGFTDQQRPPNVDTKMVTANAQDLLAALYSMSTDDLTRLQRKLWDGGFYQSDKTSGVARKMQPTWGIADDATRIAYMSAMQMAITQPDKTLDEVMSSREGPTLADQSAARKAAINEKLGSADRTAAITSTATLNSILDKLAPAMLGHGLSDEDRKKYLDLIQGEQTIKAQKEFDISQKRARADVQGVSDDEVNRFLDLVQTNNKGGTALGFDPKEWSSWVQKVGLPADTPMSPENQRQVAKELVLDYYSQFHNWRDVATAYFAGAGSGVTAQPSTLADSGQMVHGSSGPPIQTVADTVARGMTSGQTPFSSAPYGGTVIPIQSIDPAAELEQKIKTDNPTEYWGHETASRYEQFQQMLGGK